MKAWKVTCSEFPEMVAIYKAPTDTMARYRMVFSAKDAGYELKYLNTRAVRAPEWDRLVAINKQWCVGWNDGVFRWGCLEDKQVNIL